MCDCPLEICDAPGCPGVRPDALLIRTNRGRMCHECWNHNGRPGGETSTVATTHAAELEAREKMTARGGTDRHLVRNGRT